MTQVESSMSRKLEHEVPIQSGNCIAVMAGDLTWGVRYSTQILVLKSFQAVSQISSIVAAAGGSPWSKEKINRHKVSRPQFHNFIW